MNINGQEINIDDMYDQKYMHKEIKKDIFLSDNQITILNMYGINPYNCSSIEDLIFQIEEVLDEENDADDLEMVETDISEFNYYANTNK